MDVLVTLFYILFAICVVHPPAEFVSAGFTIPQLFDNFLGSENTNFVGYHMKRTTITALIHSALPVGYVVTLWCAGQRGEWMLASFAAMMIIPGLVILKLVSWWEHKSKHPIVKPLIPYVTPGIDWRVIAADLNTQFRSVDKVSIPLSATSKFVVTQIWLIKLTQYGLNLVKQSDCTLVATAADRHNLSTTGEDEVQYVNIEVIPTRDDIEKFSFRISTTSLRELQPRLDRAVRVPENISLLPTLIERFIEVFKQHIEENPVYITDQELELCIGCMQNTADVKLNRRCDPQENVEEPYRPCEQCNCRVLWCCSCMARWWVSRAGGPPSSWLAARGSCPVCRAVFCLLDVSPARPPP
ncbi:E3 ubiquitin-protein ligase TM129 [Melitaea cinxia]|uniref:E3 ubiquitin-protein ligase TM129 n=1 Tax=Melitaea cinxia TaxID=113334 RepID=UPI001E26E967|nr:E3 ubiquitin-protein ligase TM129 [Melitaea cinxia]